MGIILCVSVGNCENCTHLVTFLSLFCFVLVLSFFMYSVILRCRKTNCDFKLNKIKRMNGLKNVTSLLLGMFMLGNVEMYSEEPVPLKLREDPELGYSNYPKSPIQIPAIAIDGHTLYVIDGCDGVEIELVGENGLVVYSDIVAEGEDTIVLPATLTGTYEIRIIRGSFTFVGEIEL